MPPPLYFESPRGQCVVLLFATLREIGGVVTKREAIAFIKEKRWFALQQDDDEPYPSQRPLTREPRWHTLIAWARKDSVIRDFVTNETHDAWALTRSGRDLIDRVQAQCARGDLRVNLCFLWSTVFKKFMLPAYMPSPADSKRPRFFYRDAWHNFLNDQFPGP